MVQAEQERRAHAIRRDLLRPIAVVVWAALLLGFWLLLRGSPAGPLDTLRQAALQLASSPWAPLVLLALYGLRPLLLVPITVLNVASGFALGPLLAIPLALTGTLISASSGYAIGRLLGPAQAASTSRFATLLRKRTFESVAAGGLMYLHADLVNLPAGMLRLRFPAFLLGIVVGNSLTLTMAVMAGAAIDADAAGGGYSVNLEYVALAVILFAASVILAQVVRRRLGVRRSGSG